MSRRVVLARVAGVGLVGILVAMPVVVGPYELIVLSRILVFAIACLGLNLLLGHTGLLSFGHAAYFGVGGYAGAFLFTFGDLRSLEQHLAVGVAAAVVTAAVFGFLATRATLIHFTVLTLALGQVVHALVAGGAVFKPFGDTGKGFFLIGNGGLYIPRFSMAGIVLEPGPFDIALYYVIVGCFLATAVLLRRLVNSPFGLALRGIRESETRAACTGLAVRRLRWMAFVISGGVAGLAGALGAQLDRQVTPEQLDWLLGAKLVVATVLGGTREFWGPVLGALVVVALEEASLRMPLARSFVLGSLLIAIALLLPRGLAGVVRGAMPRWPASS